MNKSHRDRYVETTDGRRQQKQQLRSKQSYFLASRRVVSPQVSGLGDAPTGGFGPGLGRWICRESAVGWRAARGLAGRRQTGGAQAQGGTDAQGCPRRAGEGRRLVEVSKAEYRSLGEDAEVRRVAGIQSTVSSWCGRNKARERRVARGLRKEIEVNRYDLWVALVGKFYGNLKVTAVEAGIKVLWEIH